MLTRLIDSFNALQGGTQQLVVLALGIALPAAGAFLLWISSALIRRIRIWTRNRNAERRRTEEALARRRQPANPNLGLYDHAVRVHPATSRTLAAISASVEQFSKINELLTEWANRVGDEQDHSKKQRMLQQFARQLKPHVAQLQATARSMEDGAKGMVDGYRVLFSEAMIQKHEDAKWLAEEKTKFEHVAAQFPTGIGAVTRRRDLMVGLRGKEQSLTGVADRYLESATQMIQAMELVQDFCGDEMPSIVKRRLGWRWRVALLLRNGILRV